MRGQTDVRRAVGGLLLCLALLFAAAPASAAPAPETVARQAMRQGLKAYTEDRFEEAAEHFSQAAELPLTDKLDPAAARYNEGLALLALGERARAVEAFEAAGETSDLDLQYRTAFNLGVIRYREAEEAIDGRDAATGLERLLDARQSFERAILLAPEELDAKINYELTLEQEALLREQLAAGRSALEQARAAALDGRLLEAAELLEGISEKTPAALQLDEKLARKVEDMLKRLEQVLHMERPKDIVL